MVGSDYWGAVEMGMKKPKKGDISAGEKIESIDFFDNETLDWMYKDHNGKLVVVVTENIYGEGDVSINVRLTQSEAFYIARILERWATTGKLSGEVV